MKKEEFNKSDKTISKAFLLARLIGNNKYNNNIVNRLYREMR